MRIGQSPWALFASVMPRRLDRSLTQRAGTLRIDGVLPESGPVAQLGARFHGMEEVTGSIPVRSTNHFNSLDWPNRHRQVACVVVCVITRHFAAIGKGFHRCALGFHTNV